MRALLPIAVAALLLIGTGCPKQQGAATTSGDHVLPSDRVTDPDVRRVLDTALGLYGAEKLTVRGRPFRADCSGFVSACWYAAGRELVDGGAKGRSGTELIYWSLARRRGLVGRNAARPGDLVFFHDTYDRNGNGARDDTFTHVALVEMVDPDGTVHYTHHSSGNVKRGVLNPRHPNKARDPDTGKTWNSFLRRGRGDVLAGQLFYRFGRP